MARDVRRRRDGPRARARPAARGDRDGGTRRGPHRATHVFGFAHFARAFHDLFARLSRDADVYVYSLSPCEGFWEDFDPRDPLPLQLWARPGREHVRSLNAVAGFEHDDRFVEPDAALASRARAARSGCTASLRGSGHHEPLRADDESVLILAHASVRRELEAVASEIWRLLEGDETLRFDDIAVLVPEGSAQEYLAHLAPVFREAHEIPHRRVDLPAGSDDGVTAAVDLVLGLALGRFTRQEVLAVALHPAIAATLEGADSSRWLQWCDALGVVHGADHADHRDTYIERDILNWDQGLRRLALGAFMSGDASGARAPFEAGGEAYVPHEIAMSEMRDAAALGLLVRSLVADARFVQGATLPLKDWAALLGGLAETYVTPREDGDAEELARCLRSLHTLGSVDLGGASVSCRVALELARGRIATPDRGRGTEGVVVARLGAARPMPSRVTFACGMGEGKFPSSDTEDPLDLRRARRFDGDVTPRERDKYAFLEALLGARDRLILSYVSRDPLTGDTLAPSSVVEELRHTIGHDYGRSLAALERRHPLRRWDPGYFPEIFGGDPRAPRSLGTMRLSEAQAEARTWALRLDAESNGTSVDRASVETRAASDPAWAALADHLRLFALPQGATPAQGRIALSMHALVQFLDFPLQGWARYRLGLDELEEDDVLAREDEPFETRTRDETMLLREVFFSTPEDGTFERAYDDVARGRELRGSGPTGVFAEGERTAHLRTLETWAAELSERSVSRDSTEVHRFGRAGERSTADHAHPALVIEVDVPDAHGVTRLARVELGGRTLPIGRIAAPGGLEGVSVGLFKRMKESREDWARAGRQRTALRAFVDHAVLSASGITEGSGHAALAIVATPDRPFVDGVSFAPLSRGEAVSWLRGVVRELLTGQHTYFLPSEAVLVWRSKGMDGPLVRWIEAAREMMGDGDGPPALRSAYGPVPRTHEYPIPDEERARALVATRFGAIFDKWREGT